MYIHNLQFSLTKPTYVYIWHLLRHLFGRSSQTKIILIKWKFLWLIYILSKWLTTKTWGLSLDTLHNQCIWFPLITIDYALSNFNLDNFKAFYRLWLLQTLTSCKTWVSQSAWQFKCVSSLLNLMIELLKIGWVNPILIILFAYLYLMIGRN